MSSRGRRLCKLAATRGEGTDHASEYLDELISGDSFEDVDVAEISALNFHAMAESTKVQRAFVGRVMEYGPILARGVRRIETASRPRTHTHHFCLKSSSCLQILGDSMVT